MVTAVLCVSRTGGNPRDSTVSWGLRGGEGLWDTSDGSGTGGNPRDSTVSWGILGTPLGAGTQGRGGTVVTAVLCVSRTGRNPKDSTVSWGLRGGEGLWDTSDGSWTGEGLHCILGNPRDSSVSWELRGGEGLW